MITSMEQEQRRCPHRHVEERFDRKHGAYTHCLDCGMDFLRVIHPGVIAPGHGKRHMSKKERLQERRTRKEATK